MDTARFIQITAPKGQIYALDVAGQVWVYEVTWRDNCAADIHNHICPREWMGYWRALPADRGFPGWPPTEKELADAEVDALLGEAF